MVQKKQNQVGLFIFLALFLGSWNALAKNDPKINKYDSETPKESQKTSPQLKNHPNPSTKGSIISGGIRQGAFNGPIFLPESNLGDRPVSLPEICRAALRNPVDLETRLSGCPWLRDQVVWETGNGTRISYPDWAPAQKDRLNELFQALLREDNNLGIHCPDPRVAISSQTGKYYLSADEAFDVYAVHVAHVFYLEATNRVPWSITNLPPAELEEFLASYNYQSRIVPTAIMNLNYPPHIQANRDFQRPFRENSINNLICDPRDGYRFIRGETSSLRRDLLGATEEETLKNLTWWFYNNVRHTGPGEYGSRAERVQYAYLKDRLRYRGVGVASPAGCHTAANLFYDMAKSVNIPLKVAGFFDREPASETETGHYGSTMHGGLVFRWARPGTKVLWHVDLIYANFGAIFPIEEGLNAVRMREDRTKQKFFDTTWLSPTELQSWGFRYFSELPIVIPGIDYGLHSRGPNEDVPNFGYFGGFWQLNCPQDVGNIRMPCLERASVYEAQFQLCPWDSYLQSYCFDETGFHAELDAYRPIRPMSFSLPAARSARDNFSRVGRCVQAYGGCDGLNTLMSEYNRAFGADTWSDR